MTIRGITLDTGALVAILRRKQRGNQLLELAKLRLAVLSVPVPVLAEWWRGRTDVRAWVSYKRRRVKRIAAAAAA
jgi:hypothetical protein